MRKIPNLLDAGLFTDERGKLGVLEGDSLPFPVRRMYYLYDVPTGMTRGEHGHKRLEQVLLCIHGSCEIELTDSRRSFVFKLDSPCVALHIPPGYWRRLVFHTPGTICCVLASLPFDRDDYIYSYAEFETWAKARQTGAVSA